MWIIFLTMNNSIKFSPEGNKKHSFVWHFRGSSIKELPLSNLFSLKVRLFRSSGKYIEALFLKQAFKDL